jgi:predicted amidohydrolase YtcJ
LTGTRFHNGRIYTLDGAGTIASAIAACEGRVVAVGNDANVRARYVGYQEVDLGGATVFPGFTDSHIHFASVGLALGRVSLEDTATLHAAVARVAAAAAKTPLGAWIRGRGWDQNVWRLGRFPSRDDLDAATPDHPVALSSKDGHLLWCNTAALRAAGIDAGTTSPFGGEVEAIGGRLTGILKEAATALVTAAMPAPTDEEIEAAVLAATPLAHREGLTGIHEVTGLPETTGSATLRAFQRLRADGRLSVRVLMGIPEANLDAAIQLGLRSGVGDDTLRIGFLKIFADGTLGSQTASMLAPFEGSAGNVGIAIHTRAELIDLVGRAAAAGIACAIHAIGDRANRWALDAFEAALPVTRRFGLRQRLEHVQVIHPDDLPRLAAAGVIASMQPTHATSDRDAADRYWGERSRTAYAWRSLQVSGAVLAFGSDAPVETFSVLRGLHAAVFRHDPGDGRAPWRPEETISMEAALRAYTNGAAYAAGEESTKGSLEPGKVADFVALDRDVLRDPVSIAGAQVTLTVVGGVVRYAL